MRLFSTTTATTARAVLGLVLSAALPTLVSCAYDATACNNSPSLCGKNYSSIMHLGAHNSAFVRTVENSFATAGNQFFNATVQLSAGVRLLQSQIHLDNSTVRLCHTSCSLFDGGLLVDWLRDVATWMDAHPSEVVTVLLVNSDRVPAAQLMSIFAAAGLAQLAFVPDGSGWPTLREMIAAGKRLVAFLSVGADTAAVPYLLPEFQYIFETEFEVTDPANYTCYASRPAEFAGEDRLVAAVESGRMGFMNRFLYNEISESLSIYSPNDTYSATLHSDTGVGNLREGITKCTVKWGRRGGFVLLDFVDEGDPMKIVDAHNNVTNPVNREGFPANPKVVQEEKKADEAGGITSLRRLAERARNGTVVNSSQWIFAAGSWAGTWKMNV